MCLWRDDTSVIANRLRAMCQSIEITSLRRQVEDQVDSGQGQNDEEEYCHTEVTAEVSRI